MTVSAPQSVAHGAFDLVVNRRLDGGVSDIGVDLHQEVAADDHRLELEVIDVRWMMARQRAILVADEVGREPFTGGDKFHLRRDLSAARVIELRADEARSPARATQSGTQLRQAVATSCPCGPLVSYNRTGGSPPPSVTASSQRDAQRGVLNHPRSGARCARRTHFWEFGKAVAKSIMSPSLRELR
jgi:hypothetical protein